MSSPGGGDRPDVPDDAPRPDAPDDAPPVPSSEVDVSAEEVAAAGAAAGSVPEALRLFETEYGPTETEERFARPEADRLSERMLDEIRLRRSGAREAAFFDLDKTIIARSSALVFSRTFMKDGLISPATVLKSLYAQAVYQLVGADHDKMEQMRHAMLDLTKGWEAERVRRLVRETMEEVVAPLVYREALELFDDHRRRGRDLWVISSSGEEVVIPFAAYLGVHNVIATRSGIDDEGRYDGTLEFYAYARNKATAVRQVAEALGYDLDRCYGYSDSITDLPMLSVVGHPVAVNPDRELRAAATAMGWGIQDFHSPVSLRDRLPDINRPSNEVLAGAVGVLATALFIWRYVLRGSD